MKADHGRPELGQHVRRFTTEGQSARPSGNGVGVYAEFGEVPRERGPPDRFALGAGLGLGMTEEVHVERLRGLRSYGRQLVAHAVRPEHGAGKRPEPARVGNRHGERTSLHAGQRGLDDRERDPD